MATLKTETIDEPSASPTEESASHPALLLCWSGSEEAPQAVVLPLGGRSIELGREELQAAGLPDGRTSRRHVRIELEKDRWSVHDLESRNGTFVNGHRVRAARDLVAPVIRIGRTLLLPVVDASPYAPPGVTTQDGIVMGATLRAVHQRIALAAQVSTHLLLHGETGSGKELAVATFHEAAGKGRPLISINCATIPRDLAERILFGARRGAYTGAASDMPGLVQSADGGTLFLDEIGELELEVQAKLLRAIEQKQVTPLGAVAPVSVQFRLCAATHKDLRAAVVEGRFREDLYFRISRPLVRIPPLRERREEIPWLVTRALELLPTERAGGRHVASAELVEACLLRRWPGNVRELLSEIKTAALSAAAAGRSSVLAADLDPAAGHALTEAEPGAKAEETTAPEPSSEDIDAALRSEQGNIARAAARLGMARSRLRRYIERNGIDVKALRSD